MITADTFKRGLNKGLTTTWELAKVVIPVYILVTFLKHTPALGWLAAALLTRNLWLWLAPFIVHLGITLAAGWASYRNAREYRCLGCGYRWR